MFTYQKTHRYFAQVADGVEELASTELEQLGAVDVKPTYRGLYFNAEQKELYRINYRARLITRVLAPLLGFDCHSTKYLYKTASQMDWDSLLTNDQTFAIFANVSASHIRHSQYAARVLKDAIVDQFKEATGERPSVDPQDPDLWLNLHIHRNRATIHVDCSGGSLHRRGYRQQTVEAPMQETLAAAVLRLSGWKGDAPLVDPFCGSGTLLSEALMVAGHIPAAHLRERFGFEQLPDFNSRAWKSVRKKADAGIVEPATGLIAGSDISSANVEIARANLSLLPGGDRVELTTADFRELGPFDHHVIIANPPYGKRVEGRGRGAQDIRAFCKDLGDWLKGSCKGSTAYLYFGDRELLKHVGLRAAWKRPLKNGPLDGRLARYDLY